MFVSKKINPSFVVRGDTFFHIKNTPMLYFLIKKGNELHIQRVHPKDEITFRLLYDQQIIVEGNSVKDVMMQFDELPLIIDDGW